MVLVVCCGGDRGRWYLDLLSLIHVVDLGLGCCAPAGVVVVVATVGVAVCACHPYILDLLDRSPQKRGVPITTGVGFRNCCCIFIFIFIFIFICGIIRPARTSQYQY